MVQHLSCRRRLVPHTPTGPSSHRLVDAHQGLGKLWSAWAPTLEDVRLIDLSVSELDPWATLPAIGACGALTSLRLLLREPMAPEVAVIDVGALPQRLEQLALRHVVVASGDATERRWGGEGLGGVGGAGRSDCVQQQALAGNLQLAPRLAPK
jgi:hypothetical protein